MKPFVWVLKKKEKNAVVIKVLGAADDLGVSLTWVKFWL